MFVAAAIAIVVGAVLGAATAVADRTRIADEVRVAALVGVSGALAGWALFGTVLGLGTDGADAWDAAASGVGALVMVALAWRGRRRTFGDIGLTAHSVDSSAGEPQRVAV